MFYISDGETLEIKVNFGKYKYPLTLFREGERIFIKMKYNKPLTDELKISLTGMKWHGYDTNKPRKLWSFVMCEHNMTQMAYMVGMQPFNRYDLPLQSFPYSQPLREHQVISYNHFLTRRQCILAGEMGTGKSLSALAAIEYVKPKTALWVAPNSALTSVRLEYEKWGCTQNVEFMTYDGLKKYVASFLPGEPAPQVVVFDESHKLKNQTTQRTLAAQHLARSMRDDWGNDAYIFVMSGSPAPKSPIDWYSQCHIAYPGFLKEGDIYKFKDRLAIIVQKENTLTGGVYPELLGWRDSDDKCRSCGKLKTDYEHDEININAHPFEQGINEVEFLYKRMAGLTLVQSKKEVLKDLPDKIYHKIYCKPAPSIVRAASMITKRAESTIKALTLLRELSDGFQYTDVAIGDETCPLCHGRKQTSQYVYIGPEKTVALLDKYGISHSEYEAIEDVIIDPVAAPDLFEESLDVCQQCNGKGTVKKYERQAQEVITSKDRALIDLLDEYDEVGRLVIYAGFTQSVDRICEIAMKQKWNVIRLDGRGWHSTLGGNPQGFLKIFQEMTDEFERVVFVGNPGSAGTGLTLTASPAIVFYSNDFNADSRIQAEDRIHRMGMDINRGAKIIDLIHLPTDEYVLANLQKKRDLQAMSLGLVQEALEKATPRYDYD